MAGKVCCVFTVVYRLGHKDILERSPNWDTNCKYLILGTEGLCAQLNKWAQEEAAMSLFPWLDKMTCLIHPILPLISTLSKLSILWILICCLHWMAACNGERSTKAAAAVLQITLPKCLIFKMRIRDPAQDTGCTLEFTHQKICSPCQWVKLIILFENRAKSPFRFIWSLPNLISFLSIDGVPEISVKKPRGITHLSHTWNPKGAQKPNFTCSGHLTFTEAASVWTVKCMDTSQQRECTHSISEGGQG